MTPRHVVRRPAAPGRRGLSPAVAAAALAASLLPALAFGGPLPAADSLREAGAIEEATAAYAAAVAADPRSCEGNYGLARVATLRKNRDEAARHLDAIAKVKECQHLYLIGSAALVLAEGNVASAESLLYLAAKNPPGNETRRELEKGFIAVYEAKDYPAFVLEHLDSLAAVSSPSATLQMKRGRILVSLRRYDEGLAAFGKAIAADPGAEEAYREIATLYKRAKQPVKAAETLSALASALPTAENALAAAEAWTEAGRAAEARDAFGRAAALDSTNTGAVLGLARASVRVGDQAGALAAYGRLPAGTPLTAEDEMNIGRALQAEKRYPEAREAFLRAAALDPTSADARFYAGYTLFAEQKFKEAIPHFEGAIALDSTSAAAYVNLGLSLVQAGRGPEGAKALEKALELRGDDASTRMWLAQAYSANQNWGKAAEAYRGVIAADSSNAEAWRGLGYVLLNQERFDEAVRSLKRALAIEPGNVQGLIWLAQGYGLAGNLEESEATFKKALAVDPRSQEAKEGLEALEKSMKGKRKTG